MVIVSVFVNDVDLLIFDLDGTLFDSVRVNFEAIKAGMADLGWENTLTEDDVWKIMGESNENAYRKLLTPERFLEREKLADKVKSYYTPLIADYGRSFPRVLETLKALKGRGYKLALYSYAFPGYFNAAISKLGIAELFDFAECVETNNLTKIELIDKIKKHFSNPGTAVIGDSIHDIDAAKKTGNISVGVCYGYGGEEMKTADIAIGKIFDLLSIFDRRIEIVL